MDIGNQIKQLRLRRGITQEAIAQHLGVTAQAVSKWERGVTTPDICMLPELSAYFGVTIDELFAISDDTRMERIQNMLWDVRFLDPAEVESSREFLLKKAQMEPENGRPHELLADLENHLAREHQDQAAQYAKEALKRDPKLRYAHGELIGAMNGEIADWNASSNYLLIDFYQNFIKAHPECKNAYLSIMDQLIADYRLDEASAYCDQYANIDQSYRVQLYRGKIAWKAGNRENAFSIWRQMAEEFPHEWCVYHNIADYLTRAGDYQKAEEFYKKAIDIQPAPRYTDPFEALAQFYERTHNYSAAIATLKEELDVFEKEWNFTTGESAEANPLSKLDFTSNND